MQNAYYMAILKHKISNSISCFLAGVSKIYNAIYADFCLFFFFLVSINSNMFRNFIYYSQYAAFGFLAVLSVIIAKGNMLIIYLVCWLFKKC